MVAVAAQDIGPYTIIQSDMVQAVEKSAREAAGAYGAEDVVGKIATQYIKAGEPIHRSAALPIEDFRFVSDMGLEITSFPARFDEMVGGQVKPGHHINIYGYRERGADLPPETILIASDVWVVDVRTARGGEAALPTPTPGAGVGFLGEIGGRQAAPASIVTVAAEPSVVWRIIDTLGAQGFQAWVTLSGRQAWTPTPTATPTLTPTATATPTPTTPPPEVGATATPLPGAPGGPGAETPTPGVGTPEAPGPTPEGLPTTGES